MLVDTERHRIVCLSQDPNTIFSYGLQVRQLIVGIPEYQWHVISSQYMYGRPEETTMGYVRWAYEDENNKTVGTLKKVIDYTDPLCVFSMGDIHHYPGVPFGKRIQIPWVSWYPWDSHDAQALLNGRSLIEAPDIGVAMSDFQFDFLKKYGLRVDERIYNIVNTDTFKPMTKEEFNRKKLEEYNPALKDIKVLLFVGRPSWRKNIEFLLGAYKEILRSRDDVILYLHVDFDDKGVEGKANLSKIIHSLNLDKKIMYTPENQWTTGVSEAYLNRLYNLADLYVTTHGGEGFGLPIAEAMATGTPFVATNCTTMPEFSGDGKRGLLASVSKNQRERGIIRPWVDIDDFVKKVLYMLENNDERKKMGRNGMKWVNENCSHKIIIPQWKRVFNDLDVPLCRVSDDGRIQVEWSDTYVPETDDVRNKLD